MKLKFLFLCALLVPFAANAGIYISEIMYDPEGSDSDKEWVEVVNVGTSPVDLSEYRIGKGGVDDYKISYLSGKQKIDQDETAIIALVSSDPSKTPGYFSSLSANLFASASLSSFTNSGGTIVLKNKDRQNVDSVTYDKNIGASGDGNSLQKNDNKWIAQKPSPGYVSTLASVSLNQNNSAGTNQATESYNVQGSGGLNMSNWPTEPKIYTNSGGDRTIVSGVTTEFTGKTIGLKKEPIDNARYVWNFGDGATGEGQTVSHTYIYPGVYSLVLDSSSGYYSASDKAVIKVISSPIVISNIKSESPGYLELMNNSKQEVELSGWIIISGNSSFTIPRGTYIGSQSKVIFPEEITKLSGVIFSDTKILYPNGSLAYKYNESVGTANNEEGIKYQGQGSGAEIITINSNSQTSFGTTKKTSQNMVKNSTGVLNNLATAGAATKDNNILIWILAAFGIAIASGVGVILSRGMEKTDSSSKEIEEYEIIEG